MTGSGNRIVRFSLTSADPAALAVFYQSALGFEPAGVSRIEAAPYGVAGAAIVHRLTLGRQEIELVGFEQAGAPYPAGSTSHDGWFQHLALVTSDIGAAHARLAGLTGWQSISRDGPVALPASSGGVTAFKFRDPEGHPLEFLAFPADKAPAAWTPPFAASGPCVGIDHSAVAVSDGERSIAFYGALGLTVSSTSLNTGAEQDALDGADSVVVAVTGLSPGVPTPHLELLAYRKPGVRPGTAAANDVACTRTILSGITGSLRDPDGHIVMAAP